MGFDPKENYYKVSYNNGDMEEFTPEEVCTLCKSNTPTIQSAKKPKPTLHTLRAHSLYIPTPKGAAQRLPKAHTPIPRAYTQSPTKTASFTKGYKHAAQALILQHLFMARGLIWDEELKKFAAYKDLSKHPNPTIRHRWTTSG